MQITIEPNEKYWRVIDPVEHVHGEDTDYEEWSDEDKEAADAYLNTIENAPTTEDIGEDPEDLDTLSWDDFSVSSDPDLVSKMATYFTGMYPDEPTDRLRAKLRLVDCDHYANAQVAAQAELNPPPAPSESHALIGCSGPGCDVDVETATDNPKFENFYSKTVNEHADGRSISDYKVYHFCSPQCLLDYDTQSY